jgi:L-lactate dehydrogenase complex protein LldG
LNAREKILSSIAVNKPEAVPYPEVVILSENSKPKMLRHFTRMLENIGGKSIETENLEILRKDLELSLKKGEYVVNTIPAIGLVNTEIDISDHAISLAAVDRVILKSSLGVAENGSVWLTEKDMVNRLLPFICQHLVIVLEQNNIVANMHEAYEKIGKTDAGYHVFISGPSKTADIEQSLVIGAHGARSMLVYLVKNMY